MIRRKSSTSSPVGTQSTERRADGVVLTRLEGKVTVPLLDAFGDDYCALGGRFWIVDAIAVDTYEPAAVGRATASFPKWARAGLERMWIVTRTASIRMAAVSVRFPVRVATGVDVEVVEHLEAADRAILDVRATA